MNSNNDVKKESRLNVGNRYVSGISWWLFAALILFVVLVFAVIWIFQVVLLNDFYESAKLEELRYTDQKVMEAINRGEGIDALVTDRAIETDSCIRIFEMKDGVLSEISSYDVNVVCTLHHMGDDYYRYYNSAMKRGGLFVSTGRADKNAGRPLNTIMVTVNTASDGKVYVIMQDSELQPLDVTVKTLQNQFGWIMSILIIGALAVALVITRIVCLPMQRMSQSAKRLAKGDYNARFEGGGYREADELADALNYAASELQKTDNLQKELVANISHDLRTPLTMIKGYSEVIRDIPEENTPENLQIIIDETERLTELVNDMLDLSKIKAGTRKPEKEIFELTETVAAVLMRYEKFTEKENYDIKFFYEESVSVCADRTMMLQVVYNLINNALNYTGDDKTVVITQTVSEGRVRISVTDTGVGISEDDIPYIWDRYFKVDKVHKRAVVGTGLGLSIVKGILESHGASYGIESKIGEGSTFYFELDVIENEEF